MLKKIFVEMLAAFLLLGARNICQNKNEIYLNKDDLPAIRNFELKLKPVLAKACAEKDYHVLRYVKAEVKEDAQKIYSIHLKNEPMGKKATWDAGIKEFKVVVNRYYKCSSGKDDAALLAAAIRLHSAFENLVRIIRPVSKEIDEFQTAFYLLYNKYLPYKEYDKMLSLKDKLVDKAEAITKVTLPDNLKENRIQIQQAEDELLKAVKKFALFNESSKAEDIELGVENINQRLEYLVSYF